MKHVCRKAAVLLSAILLAAVLLTACSGSDPSQEDAEKYVQAVMDLMCTGDYDHSVTFADVESGKEQESRESMIESIVTPVAKENGMSEEQTARFREFISKAYSACRYSITGSEQTDDGGYDVTVSIEPLMIFNGISEALEKDMEELTKDPETALTITEEEQKEALTEALFRHLDENLENPEYAPAEEVVVRYGVLDDTDGLYGIDEEAGSLLGQKLFSAEGLQE